MGGGSSNPADREGGVSICPSGRQQRIMALAAGKQSVGAFELLLICVRMYTEGGASEGRAEAEQLSSNVVLSFACRIVSSPCLIWTYFQRLVDCDEAFEGR